MTEVGELEVVEFDEAAGKIRVSRQASVLSSEDNVVYDDVYSDIVDEDTMFETNDDDDETVIEEYVKLKGMIKDHYISKSLRKKCNGCNKGFSISRRPQHCRKCGEVFCVTCVKNKLKLNRLAHPDPNGKLRKVCKECYHEGSFEFGCSRSMTAEFENERKLAKYSRIVNNRVNSLTTTFWPDQVDRKKECQRLLKGFHDSVSRLGNSKTIQEIRVLMKTPNWQKSKYWEIEVQSTKCRSCHIDKGIRKSSGNCRVCGLALCKKCSTKDLLLFIHEEDNSRDARLTINKTKYCPQTEPDLSLLLYTCKTCKDYIIDQQDRDILWLKDEPKTLQDELVKFNDQLYSLCEHINNTRKKIEDLFEDVDKENINMKSRNMISSNIGKLKERLNEFDLKFKTLRSFAPQAKSRTERRFLRHYTKGKYDYLMENKCKSHAFSNKLEKYEHQSKLDCRYK